MKSRNKIRFFLIIVIIGLLTFIAANGIESMNITGAKDIRTGIDIRGGVSAILVPSYPENQDYTAAELQEDMESAELVINKRLDAKGIVDRSVTIDNVNNRIMIDIPWAQGETNFNPDDTLSALGATALLTFQEVDVNDYVQTESGELQFKPTGKVVLHGNMIKNAGPSLDNETNRWQVALELNDEGTEAFAEATSRLIGQPIAIFMDDQFISAPTVSSVITGGRAVITNQRDAVEAGELASTIRSGALPFKLETVKVDSISPMLGQGALDIAIIAGIVALILVCLFMLIYYRLPGLLANIALLGLVVMQLLVLSWFGITLTLPGIGGIILSVGLGVDANVIIFERIREELKEGKTLKAAIDMGFKRAFTAVLDANVTTLITAIVLYSLGSGAIKGFAITLGLGVILSFITAITASRIMLQAISDIDFAKNRWLYGA